MIRDSTEIFAKEGYFTTGELIEALSKYPNDTDIYVSQGRRYGSLCRCITEELDGTITLSCEKE